MTERTIKMLADLDETAQPVFKEMFERLDSIIGENRYIAFEGRRKLQVQEAYFAQGRETLEAVNEKRNAAGLYLLRSEKENYCITWTMNSKHLGGKAMDILPTDGQGNATWDLAHYRVVFETIRNCARASGLVCGADWEAPHTDWPHYETTAA